MILFFYGQNDFLISRKVRELKNKYLEKAGGDLNLITIDGTNLPKQDYLRQIQAVPLLSSSRLIIIENIFQNKNREIFDEVKISLKKIPSSTVLLFLERANIDKRLGLFKVLSKLKDAHEFKNVEPFKLPQFIRQEVKKRNAKIENSACELLSLFAGDDLWRISNEIEKLICFTLGDIKKADVELLVEKNISSNIFAMTHDLALAKKDSAFLHLDALLKSGEVPLRVLALINYQFRTISQIKEAAEKSDNQFAIAKQTGIAPFQISKILSISKKITYKRLSEIYSQMGRIDEEIKTGKIEDSEGLKDLVLSI